MVFMNIWLTDRYEENEDTELSALHVSKLAASFNSFLGFKKVTIFIVNLTLG